MKVYEYYKPIGGLFYLSQEAEIDSIHLYFNNKIFLCGMEGKFRNTLGYGFGTFVSLKKLTENEIQKINKKNVYGIIFG